MALILGALRIGAVSVVGNHLLPASKLRFLCEDTEAKLVIVSALSAPALVHLSSSDPPRTKRLLFAGSGEPPDGLTRLEDHLENAAPDGEIADVSDDHPSCWQYTHGSSGEELAVVHTHRALMTGAAPFARGRLGMNENDVSFSMAKLYFGYGFGNSFVFPLATGASAILYSGRSDVYAVCSLVARERPTIFFGVPTFYQSMLKVPSCAERYDLSSVCIFVSAGRQCLLKHPWVTSAQVGFWYDDDRVCHLDARVTLKPGSEGGQAAARRLREHLREHLLSHNWPTKLAIDVPSA